MNNEQNNNKLSDKLRELRLSVSIDGENILELVVCAVMLAFFSLLQTTLFAKFRPFGAVPDLILPLTVAVSMTEKEKVGAVFGLVGAVVIESLGGSTFTILPILYTLVGYICGILTTHYFRDSVATRALYTVVTCAFRAVFTLIALFATTANVTLADAFTKAVIPEYISSVCFAAIPHIVAKIALHRFNRSREEKTN